MSRYSNLDCKVYVGDLPRDASERELEHAFNYYGPVRKVWVARNPPGFAFIEFDDPRDADDAVHGLDGKNLCGNRVRVERSNGRVRPKPWNRGPPRRSFDPADRCYECGERGHYAYDCRRYRGGGRSSRRSRSRSRSRDRRRSYSRSYSRSRSRTPRRSRSASRGRSRSRGNSPARNGDD